jgi:hypothetical protein
MAEISMKVDTLAAENAALIIPRLKRISGCQDEIKRLLVHRPLCKGSNSKSAPIPWTCLSTVAAPLATAVEYYIQYSLVIAVPRYWFRNNVSSISSTVFFRFHIFALTNTASLNPLSRRGKDHEVPVPAQMTSMVLDEYVLSSDAPRRLRCLVEGETYTFPVMIPGNEHITGLKTRIHEKGGFGGILAKDLVLLKVCYILLKFSIGEHYSSLFHVLSGRPGSRILSWYFSRTRVQKGRRRC